MSGCTTCYSSQVACIEQLNDYLQYNYSSLVFPNFGSSNALQISVTGVLLALLSLGNDKVLDVILSLAFTWFDPNIPVFSSCGGATQLVNTSKVWTPILTLANPASGTTDYAYRSQVLLTPLAVASSTSNASALANQVLLALEAEVISICSSMVLTTFPFDSQTCTMTFRSVYPMNVNFIPAGATVSPVLVNDEWLISNNSITIASGEYQAYPTLNIAITAQRSSYYYVINLIFPIISMTGMVALVFLLPCDHGEKVVLSATLVLALYVQQQTFSSFFPYTTVNDTPRLVTLTISVLYASVASLCEAVLMQTLCILSPELPVRLARRLRRKLSRQASVRFDPSSSELNFGPGDGGKAAREIAISSTSEHSLADQAIDGRRSRSRSEEIAERVALSVETLVQIKKMKMAAKKKKEAIKRAWLRVHYVVNGICFIVYLAIVISALIEIGENIRSVL